MLLAPLMHSLMAFAAPASAQPVDTSPATQAQAALHTPDVIASAVRPYAACLYGVRGLPLLLGTNGAPVTYDKKDGDCSAERQRARAAALKLLANTPVPGGITAPAFVEGTLSDIDAFVATLPARRSGGSSGRAPAVGIPMMIEDEVRPPFDRYEECLKTQISDTRPTVETVLAVFQQVITICRSVRDYAVSEAEKALVRKGWDGTRAATAAENTFAMADQSWMEMGRQMRATLVAPAPAAKRRR